MAANTGSDLDGIDRIAQIAHDTRHASVVDDAWLVTRHAAVPGAMATTPTLPPSLVVDTFLASGRLLAWILDRPGLVDDGLARHGAALQQRLDVGDAVGFGVLLEVGLTLYSDDDDRALRERLRAMLMPFLGPLQDERWRFAAARDATLAALRGEPAPAATVSGDVAAQAGFIVGSLDPHRLRLKRAAVSSMWAAGGNVCNLRHLGAVVDTLHRLAFARALEVDELTTALRGVPWSDDELWCVAVGLGQFGPTPELAMQPAFARVLLDTFRARATPGSDAAAQVEALAALFGAHPRRPLPRRRAGP